ncbi:hypothetical protein MMC28_004915 [Mycoblastus sanguinarius]|nr:hypothetical protein [Mycoblastus sanguinarius]
MPSTLGASFNSARSFQWFDNVIFEINDILFRSALADSPSSKFHPELNTHELLNSAPWYAFEKRLINEDECIQRIGHKFNIPEEIVREVILAGTPMKPVPEMLALVKELQQKHKVFAVGNIPAPTFQSLRLKFKVLNSLEHVFLSSQIGERLPHLLFFNRLLDFDALRPERTLYIGSNLDNVVSARSLGFHGIVSTDVQETARRVQSMCSDPIPAAQEYLRTNARELNLEMSNGKQLKDAFAQFLVLDVTGDESLIEYDKSLSEFPWLYGTPSKFFTYPPDIETNAIGMSALKDMDEKIKHNMMDKMLRYRDSTGILQTYLTDERVRVCATAALNTVAFFNEFGRGNQVTETEDWIYRILKNRAFRDGTRYYPTADFFLYLASRLIIKAPHLRV